MATVTMHGYVIPKEVSLTINPAQSISFMPSDVDIKINMNISIVNSVITVIISLPNYTIDDIWNLYGHAITMCRLLVDINSFSTGLSQIVVIDRWSGEAGNSIPLIIGNALLANECTSYNMTDMSKVLAMSVNDPSMFFALNDLIQSISYPQQAAVNCGRAVEGVRQIISGFDLNAKRAWKLMNKALNLDETYPTLITEHSKNPRHGNRNYIDNNISKEIVRRSWIIMNRLIEYKKRGLDTLPIEEFPLLTE